MIQSINPATNEILNEYEEYSKEKINLIIKDVSSEFDIWKTVNIKKRSDTQIDKRTPTAHTNRNLPGSVVFHHLGTLGDSPIPTSPGRQEGVWEGARGWKNYFTPYRTRRHRF